MIGNFEYSRPDLNLPEWVTNKSDYYRFKGLFFSLPTFKFNNEADFLAENNWLNAIVSKYIFPVHGGKEAENQSDETLYNTSELDYQYNIYDGKVRYVIRFNYDIEFHQKLANYSGQYLSVYFYDKNHNLYGVEDSTQIIGFDTDLIDLKKIGLTPSQQPVWSELVIELADATELLDAIVRKPTDWFPEDIVNIPLLISSITNPSSDVIKFLVTDTYCDVPILGLIASDITIIDNLYGNISFDLFTEIGSGYYQIDGDNDYANGTISIATTKYNGEQEYNFGLIDVTVSGFSTITQYDLTFDVEKTVNADPVTDLVLSDLSVVDGISGTVTISSITHNGSGNYTITSSQVLTSGTLSVSNTIYNGSDAYNIGVTKTDVVIAFFPSADFLELTIYIKETISDIPVVGLLTGDIIITDSLSGVLVNDSFTDNANGTYTIGTDRGLTSGTITVDNATYSGNDLYAYRGLSEEYDEIFDTFSGTGFEQYPTGWTLSSNNAFGANNKAIQDGVNESINHFMDLAVSNIQQITSPHELDIGDTYYLCIRYKTAHATIGSSILWFTYGAYGSSDQTTSINLPNKTNYESEIYTFSTTLSGADFGYELLQLAAYDIDLFIERIILYKLL